jgi:4'-phosphopantetheinyl transferase
MPVIFHLQDEIREVVLWHIQEEPEFFFSRLAVDETNLPSKQIERNLEWLASRYLLHELIDNPQLSQTAAKKPHLIDDHRYISISHTGRYAAVMVSHRACGLDIELDHPRLERIATKFLLPEQLAKIRGSQYRQFLYQIWCAKEAMFKAYGLGNIDFKHHLQVDLRALLEGNPTFDGTLSKPGEIFQFQLKYEKIKNYIHLVYAELALPSD